MQDAPIVKILESLTIDSVWSVLKLFYLFGIFLYILFAVVVIRQIQQMTSTLNGNFDLPLRFIGLMHFGLAIGVFLLALIVL